MSDAKEYIAGHYNDENISLKQRAAEAVSVSPTKTLSFPRKKENIHRISDGHPMQHAKELLRCSSMKASRSDLKSVIRTIIILLRF